jgi:uncharacterized protein YdcH (DUF465 family)
MARQEIRPEFASTAVSQLRHKDGAFDEICRDYESMLDELAHIQRDADAADLKETVAALERELEAYIAIASETNSAGTNGSERPRLADVRRAFGKRSI